MRRDLSHSICECRVRYNDQRYLCNDKYDTGILELVKQEMGIEFDEESLHYERFVTHLKFLAQRLYRHELLKDEEIEFAKLMENKYPGEYECSKHIAEYIEKVRRSDIRRGDHVSCDTY